MREILFRGKHHRDGWVHGYYVKRGRDHIIVTDEYGDVAVDPATVGQWTGLVDKDGVRVWEGDILSNGIDGHLWYVRWSIRGEYTGFVGDRNNSGDCSFLLNAEYRNAKVIGTIHDTEAP